MYGAYKKILKSTLLLLRCSQTVDVIHPPGLMKGLRTSDTAAVCAASWVSARSASGRSRSHFYSCSVIYLWPLLLFFFFYVIQHVSVMRTITLWTSSYHEPHSHGFSVVSRIYKNQLYTLAAMRYDTIQLYCLLLLKFI